MWLLAVCASIVVGGHSARSWNKTTKDTAASCSTWYYIPVNHTQCVCGNKLNSALVCSEKQNRVYLNIDFCMTEMESGELVVGFCRNGYQQNSSLIHNRIYTLLPENPDDLDETQCQQYNRKGLFCGECIEGYGPSVYSLKYSFACSNCSKMSPLAATALYLTLDLVPVTLLFFLIMTFRINLTKGPLLGYILFCQLHIQTVQNRLSIQSSILSNMGKSAKVFYHMALFLSSIWNLDFFKASYIVPPFCISDKITDLTALCFEYLLMVYTIVLVLLTYMCIEYYSRNPWFCVCLCKPLYILCIRIRQKWSSNESIIHAYATLLFLLFIRINSALYSFNESTPLTTTNSTEAIARVLIFSPQTKCYTREHIPYILLSIGIYFIFGFCPALFLCLYPTRLFQRAATHCCSSRKQIALKVFAETFQGCYKDGLNGTRDYRMTPAIIMFVFMILALVVAYKKEIYTQNNYINLTGVIVSICFAVIVSYVQPCKSRLMNLSLSFHSAVVSLLWFVFTLWVNNFIIPSHVLAAGFVTLLIMPHTLMLLWVGYSIYCVLRTRSSAQGYTRMVSLS